VEKPIFLVQNADRAVSSKEYKHLTPNQLRVFSQFFTLQGEGPFAGQQAHFLRLAGCNYGAKDQYCQFCFPEDHYITTVKGRQLFKDVKVGDELFALDKNGDVATTKVVKKLVREVEIADMVVVEYRMPGGRGTKKLVCTADHPFHTTTRGFVPAKELKRSDEIYHVTKNALMSAFRKENNPAWDPEVIVRGRQTFKSRYESGEIPKMVRTPEQRANYAASKMGDANPMKRHDVRLKSALGHNYPKSRLEEKFDVALSALGFEARYTGNTGTFVIGDDKQGYRLPDFKLPGKKVIEIYDTNFKYYKEGQRTKQNYEGPIRRFYKKFGYDCLFLTNKDLPKVGKGNLADLVDFKPVKEKVGMFLRNGARIISVRPLRTSSLGKYRNANGKVSVVNFSCKPYNTFLVGGLHVHNCDTSFQYDHGQDMSFDAILEDGT
jgi:hypothetical protein